MGPGRRAKQTQWLPWAARRSAVLEVLGPSCGPAPAGDCQEVTQHQHCLKTREAQLWPPLPCCLLQGPLLASPDSCTCQAGQAEPSAQCGLAVRAGLVASALPPAPNSKGRQGRGCGPLLHPPIQGRALCCALTSAARAALGTASSPQGGLLSTRPCLHRTCTLGPSVPWSPEDSVLPHLPREAAPQSPTCLFPQLSPHTVARTCSPPWNGPQLVNLHAHEFLEATISPLARNNNKKQTKWKRSHGLQPGRF